MLWKSFEINTDKCNFLNIISLIKVILQNNLRLFFIAKKKNIIDMWNCLNFLFNFLFKELKILLWIILLGIKKPLYDANLIKFEEILNVLLIFLFIILIGINKKGYLFKIWIGKLILYYLKVILSKSPKLKQVIELLLKMC